MECQALYKPEEPCSECLTCSLALGQGSISVCEKHGGELALALKLRGDSQALLGRTLGHYRPLLTLDSVAH